MSDKQGNNAITDVCVCVCSFSLVRANYALPKGVYDSLKFSAPMDSRCKDKTRKTR